jgi:hypothetical protein
MGRTRGSSPDYSATDPLHRPVPAVSPVLCQGPSGAVERMWLLWYYAVSKHPCYLLLSPIPSVIVGADQVPIAYRWWDETIEAASPTGFTGATAFLDPVTGFGPNGNLEPQACVTSGPFANVKVNIGPGYQHAERCVSRVVNNNFSSLLTAEVVATSLNYDTYGEMWRDVYSKPHFWGHGALLFMVSYPTQSLHATLLCLR